MTAMGEKSVSLSRRRWVRILNLLTEELQVWETTDPVYREVQETILMIEGQTGIRKKQPSKYDIADPKERERLLWELSGYLADDKEAGRKAFLQDGTDLPGRKFALDALDELRRALPFSQRKPSGVYDPEKEIIATGFESFELMEKSRKAINTSTKKGKAKPSDDFELFMKIRTVGERIQACLVRGHLPHDSKVDLCDAENLIIAILNEMKGD